MTILVLNVGSSSVKHAAFAAADGAVREVARGQAPRAAELGSNGRTSDSDLALFAQTIESVERAHGALSAVGHRVVHGGRAFLAPVLVDAVALEAIGALSPLAPLHQPHNATAIRAVRTLRPALPQVACFDTAFHRTQPELHRRLPLPDNYFAEGIERYGFHGLSYQWLVQELARLRGGLPRRTLAFHLGAGASACALRDGRSHDTSMGFSTIDGLMMGTRPGALDPGVILHLLQQGMTQAELTDLLYTRCGLRGVSSLSADMKILLASGDPAAERAVALFCRRAAVVGAGLAVSLGGLDAVAFTGGIGAHAPDIRARIADQLGLLGVRLDAGRNASGCALISPDEAPVECWTIAANEEQIIAEATLALAGNR